MNGNSEKQCRFAGRFRFSSSDRIRITRMQGQFSAEEVTSHKSLSWDLYDINALSQGKWVYLHSSGSQHKLAQRAENCQGCFCSPSNYSQHAPARTHETQAKYQINWVRVNWSTPWMLHCIFSHLPKHRATRMIISAKEARRVRYGSSYQSERVLPYNKW